MAKGENIFKRKDGRWEARYVKGHQPSGKIQYGFCYGKSYKEAKQKVAEMKFSIIQAAPKEISSDSFAHYCEEWLRSKQSRVKPATYVKYETMMRRHIEPALGEYCLSVFSTGLIEGFCSTLQYEKRLSSKTIRDILTCLRSVIRYVGRQIPSMPTALEIVYPKEDQKEMRVLSLSEQTQLTEYLLTDMDACKFGILLALLTGLRIGEVCALRWSDINLKEKTIHIHATMQRLRNISETGERKTTVMIGSPKSDKSLRTMQKVSQW